MRIRGRIDRVDLVGGGDDIRHHVLDYKTSTIPGKSGYKDGSVLQGPTGEVLEAQFWGARVTSREQP